MPKTIIKSSEAPAPVGPYSQAVLSENLLFVSGQIAIDPQSNALIQSSFAEECHQVLQNLKAVVHAGGCTLDDVLKVNIYMTDLSQFSELNVIYAEYFGASKPARACVEVRALPKGVSLEMDAMAAVPDASE